MDSSKQHWDHIFTDTTDKHLGWHETDLSPSLSIIESINLSNKTVFAAGIGTSTLAPYLAEYSESVIFNDISQAALQQLEGNLDFRTNVSFMQHDLAQAIDKLQSSSIDLWIDRACLHFLCHVHQQHQYANNVARLLKPGGHIALAQFSTSGASQCAGLEVQRYSLAMMDTLLGDKFQVIKHFEHIYINPHGQQRPYLYALFEKN